MREERNDAAVAIAYWTTGKRTGSLPTPPAYTQRFLAAHAQLDAALDAYFGQVKP
jgi:hypothetical protein